MLKRPTRAPSGSWPRWRAHRLRLRSVRLRRGRGNRGYPVIAPGDHVLVARVPYWGVRKWLAEFVLT